MAWSEPAANGKFRVWVCQMNPATGDFLKPELFGRELEVGLNETSVPYWGQDDQGVFVMRLVPDTRAIARVRVDVVGGVLTAAVDFPPIPTNATRVPFYPSWNPNSAKTYYGFFQQNEPNSASQLFLLDFDKPFQDSLIQLTQDSVLYSNVDLGFITEAFTFPSCYYTGPRWVYGRNFLTFGVFESTTSSRIQLRYLDLDAPGPPTVRVGSDDPYAHNDDFPFQFQGRLYTAGGLNYTTLFGVHRWDDVLQRFEPQQVRSITNSQLFQPAVTSSMEPFVWNNAVYSASLVLSDTAYTPTPFGPIGAVPGEIWLHSLLADGGVPDSSLNLIVHPSTRLVRSDPEYYIGTDSVWIFYYGKPVGPGVQQLHRCSTPLYNSTTASEPALGHTAAFTVGPNPSSADRFSLRFAGPTALTASVWVVNQAGQQVHYTAIPRGTKATEIVVSNSQPGVYNILIQIGNEYYSQKWIKN